MPTPFYGNRLIRSYPWMRSRPILSNQEPAPPDPLVDAIALALPWVPSARRADFAASLRFASASDPTSALNVVASGNWVISCRPDDGCLFQGIDRTNQAATSGDPVGSVWSLKQITTPFLRQTDNALRGAIADSSLRVDIGRHLIALNADGLTGFTGWTAGERAFVMKADADPTVTGGGRFEISQTSGAIFRFSAAPGTDGNIYDRWGASNTGNGAIIYNPVTSLSSKFLLRSRFSTGARFSAVGLEAESTLADATTAYANNYALGSAFSQPSFSPFNYYFLWARSSQLTTGDRTLLYRFISHYCGLGLYAS